MENTAVRMDKYIDKLFTRLAKKYPKADEESVIATTLNEMKKGQVFSEKWVESLFILKSKKKVKRRLKSANRCM